MPQRTQSFADLFKLQKVQHTLNTNEKLTAFRHFRLHLQSESLFNKSLIRSLDFPFVAAMDSHLVSSPGNMDKCVSNSSLVPFLLGKSSSETESEDSDPEDSSNGRRRLRAGLSTLEEELEDGSGASNRFSMAQGKLLEI